MRARRIYTTSNIWQLRRQRGLRRDNDLAVCVCVSVSGEENAMNRNEIGVWLMWLRCAIKLLQNI